MFISRIFQKTGGRVGTACIAILILFQSHQAHSQGKERKVDGILFTNKNWKEVTAIARRQHKKIFVDAYATWCAPCKQLKESTFKDERVAAYFNQHFLNVSIDIEKGEGKILGEKLEISAYPTLLLLDENGAVIARSEGFVDPQQLLVLFAKEKSDQ